MSSILIVDDDNFLHSVLDRILNIGGFEVLGHAYDSADAIEKYVQFGLKPDIILKDHRMPVMNGAEATTELHKLNPHAKVIFISVDESVQETVIAAGALDFLTNPIKSKYLLEVLHKYL
jgi:CheY-like chemotaxis protein